MKCIIKEKKKAGDCMSYCEKCGLEEAFERTDLVGEPVLCDKCYGLEIYGECDCDHCDNSYFLGDRMYCKKEKCSPIYSVQNNIEE